jgi:hypothetical protein
MMMSINNNTTTVPMLIGAAITLLALPQQTTCKLIFTSPIHGSVLTGLCSLPL